MGKIGRGLIMSKKVILISIVSLMVLAVSACATPSPTNTTVPGNTPAAGGVTAPDVGIPTIAPAPAQGGPNSGTATPVAPSPNVAVSAPGAGYITSPSILNNGQFQNNGIQVTGLGQVTATPDMATLQIGVSAQASTVAAAQNSAATAMNAVMQALKSKGVADNDIQTVGFNIYPMYDYKNGTNNITGYQVSNTVTVTIRNIANISSIIDTSAAAGGNFIQVNSISFGVSDPAPYLKQARQLAVANANATATQLASLAGVTMGKPVFITESSGYYPPSPVYYAAREATPAPATPINPGTTQISVNVEIVYAIQ